MVSALLIGLGLLICSAGLLLGYLLWERKERTERRKERLRELEDLIRRTKYLFYKRKISEEKANKIIQECEGEARVIEKRIEESGKLWISGIPLGENTEMVLCAVMFVVGTALIISGVLSEEVRVEEESNTSTLGDQDYYLLALNSSNTETGIEMCSRIEDTAFRDICYMDLANGMETEEGITTCGLVQNALERDKCYQRIIYRKSEIRRDPGKSKKRCELVIDRDSCLLQIADTVGVSDPEEAMECCRDITKSGVRDECLQNLAEKFSGWYDNYAIKACGYMEDYEARDSCLNTVWLNIPRKVVEDINTSLWICDGLYIGERACYQKLVDAFIKDAPAQVLQVCSIIGADSQDECYEKVARTQENISLVLEACEKLDNVESCLEMASYRIVKENPEGALRLCDAISTAIEPRERCYANWLNNTNITLYPDEVMWVCGNLSKSDECYTEVARSFRNVSRIITERACNRINNETLREECISGVFWRGNRTEEGENTA